VYSNANLAVQLDVETSLSLYLVHLSDDKKWQCKLNTFRDVLNTIPDGVQRIAERHRSVHLFGPR